MLCHLAPAPSTAFFPPSTAFSPPATAFTLPDTSNFDMPSRLAQWTLSRTRRTASGTDLTRSQVEYHSLTSLPNELLLALLEVMDDSTLHLMVAVSKRFYYLATRSLLSRYDIQPSSGYVTLKSSAALRALRIAMTLSQHTFKELNYLISSEAPKTKDIRRIEALLRRRFWGGPARIRSVRLDFGSNIIERPVGWKIGGLAPKLLTTICGDSQTAVWVADNGLFTCKPRSLLLWSPYSRDPYCKIQMHDGSRQWVPSIRSIKSLNITYPVCTALSPLQPWTLVVVNAKTIMTLRLSIRLSAPEWSAILSSITLPHLHEVGIWAPTITSETSTAFLNRHAIFTLKYMSPAATPLPPAAPPLALPMLSHLTALSHYIVYILHARDSAALFPNLASVELWPDARLYDALHLLSSHPPLQRFTLWFLHDIALTQWPVLFGVDVVELNKSRVDPALLAHAFPALRRLQINYCFPKGKSPTENKAIRRGKQLLVNRIAQANPGIDRYFIDREFFEPQ
ncbi:hypothetical protein C8R44DRAFT_727344 [Mycena epipterygia]|nr:hypothetical protein C8R44DRAFT_727344 [Mycena epipterygia]